LATLSDWEGRMGPRARALFDRFREMIGRCGEYSISPAKTRIAFVADVRFAGITSLSERGMTCAFALPKPVRSKRFAAVQEVVPGWWVHRMRVTEVEQLDDQLQRWLSESYRLMGKRERLRRSRGEA
jgi:hypothetical protein